MITEINKNENKSKLIYAVTVESKNLNSSPGPLLSFRFTMRPKAKFLDS